MTHPALGGVYINYVQSNVIWRNQLTSPITQRREKKPEQRETRTSGFCYRSKKIFKIPLTFVTMLICKNPDTEPLSTVCCVVHSIRPDRLVKEGLTESNRESGLYVAQFVPFAVLSFDFAIASSSQTSWC